jgi:tetratricopeptide (TPR) repeat protein
MMNFVATPGRNDPCPCASGKKYKKCCLPSDEARATLLRKESAPQRAASLEPLLTLEDDGLDALSNSVIDMVNEGRFDEARAACNRLLEEFPDVPDGLERSGMLHAKMGNHDLAADFYRKAFNFVTHPSRCDDYEDADFYREQAEEQEKIARLR